MNRGNSNTNPVGKEDSMKRWNIGICMIVALFAFANCSDITKTGNPGDDPTTDTSVTPDGTDPGPCVPTGPEVCNGRDDDCDGVVDNHGVCTETGSECADGIDNDDDGHVDAYDEDCLPYLDMDGDGYAGLIDCDDLDPDVHPGADEYCNGADDDCDGSVDEFCECGEGQRMPCGTDVGECVSGFQYCEGGVWGECDGVMPDTETCDGLDNDCDGTIDEECDCRDGAVRPCGTDLGECTTGTQECIDGFWELCDGTSASSETCDGLDNDCDGSLDEDCSCVHGATQPCGTEMGECSPGTQTCVAGFWSLCDGVMPDTDICDGLDNDCDGAFDEECACVDGTTQPCGSSIGECVEGVQTCVLGAWGACVGEVGPSPEACDGLDNNCDGFLDNSEFCSCLDGATQVCGTDMGECTEGTQTCVSGSWSSCSGTMPATETCDGLDNDCNGRIDEGCSCVDGTTQPCGSNLGECVEGVQTCVLGRWGTCVGEVEPVSESCDGFDNDCDGTIDEECSCVHGDSRPCGTDIGTCTTGTQDCVFGYWSLCSGDMPETEICDGLDNNCDTRIDEGCECVNGTTQACGSAVGECVEGVQTCVLGRWGSCVGEVGPAPEACTRQQLRLLHRRGLRLRGRNHSALRYQHR